MASAPETLSHKRGEFMDAFASLEANTARLVAALAGLSFRASYSIYFRTVNARARSGILADLFEERFPREQNGLLRDNWATLEKEINSIGNERNAVVHWVVVNRGTTEERLANPVNLHRGRHSVLDGAQIDDLKIRLWTVDHIVHDLGMSMTYRDWRPLFEIFQQERIERPFERFRLLLRSRRPR